MSIRKLCSRPDNCQPLIRQQVIKPAPVFNPDIVTIGVNYNPPVVWLHHAPTDNSKLGQILEEQYLRNPEELAKLISSFVKSHIEAAYKLGVEDGKQSML